MFSVKSTILSTVTALAMISGSAMAADWTLDPTHSSISFGIDHLVISEVDGSFNNFSGTVTNFDGKKVKDTVVSVTINVESIDTNEADRDKHLRGADFFDVEKYPTATFTSTKIKKTGDNTYDMTGDFTLHGVTNEITIPMTLKGTVNDPWGNTRAGFTGAVSLDRTQWGLTFGKTLETGQLVVGNEARLEINAELVQVKEEKK